MYKKRIFLAQIITQLTDGFQKSQGLNITNHAADFHNNHVKSQLSQTAGNRAFNLIGNVWNNLHGITAKIT